MKIKRHLLVNLAALVYFLFFLATAAFAQGGDQADSPGTPGAKPLSFTSITLVNGGGDVQGASNIPTDQPKFQLGFDKNVVNSTLWETNRKCFSLVSENNESVPLSVTKIDDTIDVTQRQNIFVQPTVPLSPGTSYTLRISPDLKAKNGVSTLAGTTSGQGSAISFKTAGQAAQSSGPTPEQVNTAGANSANTPDKPGAGNNMDNTGTPDNKQLTETAGQQVANSPNADNAAQVAASGAQGETDNPAGMGNKFDWTKLLTILFVVLVAGWIGVEISGKNS